jgi:type IV secretory pathway ATPase VirB11/archaellum biosynthesis ATPase
VTATRDELDDEADGVGELGSLPLFRTAGERTDGHRRAAGRVRSDFRLRLEPTGEPDRSEGDHLEVGGDAPNPTVRRGERSRSASAVGQRVTGGQLGDDEPARAAQPTPLVGLGRVTPLALGPLLTSPPWGWLGRGSGRVDWAQVALFRAAASDRLGAALASDPGLDRDGQRELGRSIIWELLEVEAAAALSAGRQPAPLGVQQATASAVFDALFGLGRLQPLVDDDRVENITINGFDQVRLELVDGSIVPADPVADSDQDLIDFLVFLASRSEVNARPFSPATPRLHLRLDGGARLAAAAWVTPRPAVVIRRHRLQRVTLTDLVELGTLTPLAASFLAAAVRARKSIVVAGPQAAGKTTLVRALCAEIGAHEAIGTFETEYELHLHEMPDRYPLALAWEARPGSGERGPDGRQAGEFTLSDALYDSFRFTLSRQIVGEVRGPEIVAMLKAMQSGTGSISTTHATDAEGAVRKLVTCAMETGPHITAEYATRAIADCVDIVVQLHLETTPAADGSAVRDRWVSEIITLAPGERDRGYAVTHVFSSAQSSSGQFSPGGGRDATPGVLPDDYRSLERYGFDLAGFHAHQGANQ